MSRENGRRRQLGGRGVEKFDLPGSFEEVKEGHRDGQGEASRAGAAGVDVENSIVPVRFGLVSVAADDNVEAGDFRIEVKSFKVVQDVDRDILEFDNCGERKARGPGFAVNVAANGENGCDGLELVEDGRVADVACVNDSVGAFERGEGFRAEETVGIRDDAEEERFHLHGQTSTAADVR